MSKNLNKILRYPEKIPCDKRLEKYIGAINVNKNKIIK